MNLTHEQESAISASYDKLTIQACAGSGKTLVLVERYLKHILEEGVSPEKILAITFTRKAASEMKRRIVKTLFEKGEDNLARIAQISPISTAHSFCERLLREHPFDACIDPDFDVLDELRAEMLLRSCAKNALHALSQSSEEVKFLVWKLASQREWQETSDDAGLLLDWIMQVVKKNRENGLNVDALEALAQNKNEIHQANSEVIKQFLIHRFENWDFEFSIDDALSDTHKLKELLRKTSIPYSPDMLSTEELNELETITQGLCYASALCWRILLEEFEKRNVLDFSELEVKAFQLLTNHPDALIDKYEHIMVDEAQDLNPLQHKILQMLPAKTTLFVGDPQQSIYGFRGADRNVFMHWVQQHEKRNLQINWRSSGNIVSYVETIFLPFWKQEYLVMKTPFVRTPSSDDPFESQTPDDGSVELWLIQKSMPDVSAGILELKKQGVSYRDIAILANTSREIDTIAKGLHSAGIPLCVLQTGKHYFLRAEIYDVGSALRSLANPHDTLALLSLLRSPIVGLTLDTVLKIAFQSQDEQKSAWEIISKEDFQIDESDKNILKNFLNWFIPLSKKADYEPAWRLISDIYTHSYLDARFTKIHDFEALIANARRLLSISATHHDFNAIEFARWLESLQHFRAPYYDAPTLSEEADAVKLLTIHKAKGLEWDNVIVIADDKRSKRQNKLLVNRASGLPLINLEKNKKTPAFIIEEHNHTQTEDSERVRLLYVALTRAKKRLCIATSGTGDGPWAKLIRQANRNFPAEKMKIRDLTIQQEQPLEERLRV